MLGPRDGGERRPPGDLVGPARDNSLDAMSTLAISPRMTADEYLAWERLQEERHDGYDGEICSISGGTERHGATRLSCSCVPMSRQDRLATAL